MSLEDVVCPASSKETNHLPSPDLRGDAPSDDEPNHLPTADLRGGAASDDEPGRGTYVKIKSLGGVNMWKWNKLWQTRFRLHRSQIFQENIRWKALEEIYKIYMLLHRSDLNISEIFRQFFFEFQNK